MDYIVINKLITKSIYKQIADSITQAIESGVLHYNDKLPTEKEICNMFSISQTAVKMAYEKLINDGLIRRIKGKGTYVTNRDIYQTDLHDLTQLERDINIKRKVILLERSNKDLTISHILKLEQNEKYYQVTTLFSDFKNPVLLQRAYIPTKIAHDFDKHISSFHNIYDFMEKSCRFNIKDLRSTFSTINASSSESLLLRIEPDDSIYFVKILVVDENDHVICYINNYYPGHFTEFEVIVHAIDS